MKKTRRKFTSEFKTKVSIEAIRERYSLSELAKRFEVHPTQIAKWKREFLDNATAAFESPGKRIDNTEEDLDKLNTKIGRLEVERDFLKKSLKKTGLL